MKLSLKKIGTTLAVGAMLVFSGIGLFGTPAYAAMPCDNPNSPSCIVCIAANEAAGMSKADATTACTTAGGSTVDNVWLMAPEVINWILIAAGIIAVGFIIWAGIRYVTSGGDAEKVKKAKNTLLYAIIGLLIAALALVIVNLVLNIGATTTTPDI